MKTKTLTHAGNFFARLNVFLIVILLQGCGDDAPQQTRIEIKSFTPAQPATLKFHDTDPNDQVTITYDYTVVEPQGARIWLKPESTESFAGTIHYSPSPVLKGSGTRTVIISIFSSNKSSVPVDILEIIIINADTGDTIFEDNMTIDYTFTE